MKTKFSKLIVPLLLVLVAVTSAFTTDAASKAADDATLVIGYLQDDSTHENCTDTEMCSTINNGVFCRVGQQENNPRLWDLTPAEKCEEVLYKP